MKLSKGIATLSVGKKFIGLKRAVGLLFLTVTVAGCSTVAHDYSWAPYAINPVLIASDVSALSGQTISITTEGNDGERVMIGELSLNQYFGSSQQLATANSLQLSDELKRLDVNVFGDGSKTLNIQESNPAPDPGMWVVRAHLRITIEAGNGYVLEKPMSNSTPGTVPRAYNGAVSLVVVEILNDPQIVAYLGS